MNDYEKIVELGKRATKRPWTTAPYQFRNGQGYIARVDVDYLSASANSADVMAQQLLDIGKLCDEYSDDRWDAGYRIVANAVQAILERQA